MNTYLISICIAIIVIGVMLFLLRIFKDKKVDDTEKQELQKLIIDVFNQAIKISNLKDNTEELKSYCVSLIMDEVKENNIKNVDEQTVSNAVNLLVLAMEKANSAINKK